MKILFLHGWNSTPGGLKPTYLAHHGHEVLNPALPDEDFDEAVEIAQGEFDRNQPEVVVGSSKAKGQWRNRSTEARIGDGDAVPWNARGTRHELSDNALARKGLVRCNMIHRTR
jgi:hypothetical protein